MRILRWLLLTVLLVVIFLYGAWSLARSRSFQLFGGLVRSVETRDSVVALTFDDGPTAALTDSIIRVLGRRGAYATFFIIGNELETNLEYGRSLVAVGHELGNHTYSHKRMVLRSPEFIRHEVEATDSLIREAGQSGEIHFRPPYSYKLFGLPYYLSRSDRKTIMVDIEPDSYEEVAATSDGIVSHVLERVRPGSIILLHPWYSSRTTSLDAIPVLVDSLQARGYQLETVSELLTRGPPR